MKSPVWWKSAALAALLWWTGASLALAEDEAKIFFLIAEGNILAYDGVSGSSTTLVASGAVQQALLSRDTKTLFYTESRADDYPGCAKMMKAEPIATRLYKMEVAGRKTTLVKGPAKTDLHPFLDTAPRKDFSPDWELLGIRLWTVTGANSLIFTQQRLYSCNAFSGAITQLDKGLESTGVSDLVGAHIYEMIWTEKYAAIAYCPAGMIEGYFQDVFILKNGMLTETTGLRYTGYQAGAMVRALKGDGTALVLYEEPEQDGGTKTVLSLRDINTGKALFETTFVKYVTRRFIDGEVYTLDDPFSKLEKPGLYRITGRDRAVKLRDLPRLPFLPPEDYYWNWMYDQDADCVYGTASNGREMVAFVYDFKRGELLTAATTKRSASGDFVFVRGVAVTRTYAARVSRIEASSVLTEKYDRNMYRPVKVLDCVPETGWMESAPGPGIEQWLEITFDRPVTADRLVFSPGWFDGRYWANNNRIKALRVELDAFVVNAVFEDLMEPQAIVLPEAKTFTRARVFVKEVYPSKRDDDTCIAEIEFFNAGKKLDLDISSFADQLKAVPEK